MIEHSCANTLPGVRLIDIGDVRTCSICGQRYVCIGFTEWPLRTAPIWKRTVITERWPRWLRWMG